ncbi:hypothetical protein [Nocardia nova]|uniref:hypothetical protein n=1 Tax=Nocardia nova TaxID=37330 RepID=UPI0033D26CE3
MNDRPGERRDSVSALIAMPKSSVWQGFLGAATVVSTSLLIELVAQVLEGSVSRSHFLNSLAGALRWVALAVITLTVLYRLGRWLTDTRESAHIRRELDMTADLVVPPTAPDVNPDIRDEPGAGASGSALDTPPRDRDIAGVLWELPFGDYESAALYDMVTAMLDSADVLPGEHAVAYRDASGVLARLTADGVVVHGGHDRFRVHRPVEPEATTAAVDTGVRGAPRSIRRTPEWRAALPALVGHYADLAGRWVVALDSDRLGAGAHRWFGGSADRLAELLHECAVFEHGIDLDTLALARIADALDTWYARTGVRGCADAAEAMRTLAGAEHPEIADLAALRCGDLGERRPRARRWRRRRGTTGLRARRAHEIALRNLERYRHPDTHVPHASASGRFGSTSADAVVAAPLAPASPPVTDSGAQRLAPAPSDIGGSDDVADTGDSVVPIDVPVTIDANGAGDTKVIAVDPATGPAVTAAPDPVTGTEGATGAEPAAEGPVVAAGETATPARRRTWRRRGPGEDPDPLAAAVDGFERAWWLLPRRDVTGEVATLIDLAIAHLYQGRLDAARDRLELAESLTRGGRNPSGRAHTFEILGVLWWMRGEPRRALRWWLLALTRYRDLGHELGICRCLQHLGGAAVVVPGYGGLLLGDTPDQTEILAQAWAWLRYAESRRPDQPQEKPLITATYRGVIEQRLGRSADDLAATRMRWPVAVAER